MENLKDARIFIVEDDMMNMVVFSATLKRTGATILQDVWNVNSLSQMMNALPLDCILLDLMLRHDMSGYQIFEQIKSHPQLAHIPVIAVSAADPDVEIPKTQALGFAGFIGKPIKPHWFPAQILDCINGKPVWYSDQGNLEDFTSDIANRLGRR